MHLVRISQARIIPEPVNVRTGPVDTSKLSGHCRDCHHWILEGPEDETPLERWTAGQPHIALQQPNDEAVDLAGQSFDLEL
jgi:hypothetical protein